MAEAMRKMSLVISSYVRNGSSSLSGTWKQQRKLLVRHMLRPVGVLKKFVRCWIVSTVPEGTLPCRWHSTTDWHSSQVYTEDPTDRETCVRLLVCEQHTRWIFLQYRMHIRHLRHRHLPQEQDRIRMLLPGTRSPCPSSEVCRLAAWHLLTMTARIASQHCSEHSQLLVDSLTTMGSLIFLRGLVSRTMSPHKQRAWIFYVMHHLWQ